MYTDHLVWVTSAGANDRVATLTPHRTHTGEGFLWLPNLEGPTYDNGRGLQWLTDNWVDGVPPLGWHDTLCFLALPAALVVAQTISMRVLSPPPDPNDKAAQNANRVLNSAQIKFRGTSQS